MVGSCSSRRAKSWLRRWSDGVGGSTPGIAGPGGAPGPPGPPGAPWAPGVTPGLTPSGGRTQSSCPSISRKNCSMRAAATSAFSRWSASNDARLSWKVKEVWTAALLMRPAETRKPMTRAYLAASDLTDQRLREWARFQGSPMLVLYAATPDARALLGHPRVHPSARTRDAALRRQHALRGGAHGQRRG